MRYSATECPSRDFWNNAMRNAGRVFCAACLTLVSCSARAAIVLDDFDNSMQLSLPEMKNQSIVSTGIGELNAERIVGVSASQTDPMGSVDANVTHPSQLTARIDGQFLDDPQNTPLLAVNSTYDFGRQVDLTQGSTNNALFIDIASFRGSGVPPALSVLIRNADGLFAASVSGFNLPSDLPLTHTIPFSSFDFRGGGGIGEVDFKTIDLLEVRVRLLQGSQDPNVNWLVKLDRIRAGRIVPEPGTLWLTGVSLSVLLIRFGRQRPLTDIR